MAHLSSPSGKPAGSRRAVLARAATCGHGVRRRVFVALQAVSPAVFFLTNCQESFAIMSQMPWWRR
jgi:hypothetical protein